MITGLTPTVSLLALLLVLTTVVGLVGCSVNSAPVSSRSEPPSSKIMVHQVEPGETLYSIAWRYDLDFRKLARANGIREPFVINRGQLLSLDVSKISNSAAKSVDKQVKKTAIQTSKPRSTTNSSVTTAAPKVTNNPESKPKTAASAIVYSTGWQWQWPLKGKVIKAYSPSDLHKGISIKSVSRSAVRAAAPGIVVYAGEGLRGYGKLVIIKHSELLLSAYAHNDQIMVKEGQTVKQMEIVSRLGSDGTMYFEIRKDGIPVNPQTYLK